MGRHKTKVNNGTTNLRVQPDSDPDHFAYHTIHGSDILNNIHEFVFCQPGPGL